MDAAIYWYVVCTHASSTKTSIMESGDLRCFFSRQQYTIVYLYINKGFTKYTKNHPKMELQYI